MTIKITTIGSFKSTIGKIEKKDDDFSDFLYQTALLLNGQIQQRVQGKGQGSKGSSLKRYSKSYANLRSKTGRQARFRDLTWSGNMFQSLTAERIGNKQVKMFFGSATEKSKAFFNDKRTPFFSLSPSEKTFLQKELEGFAKL